MVNLTLPQLLVKEPFDLDEICNLFNEELLPEAVRSLNNVFSPCRLSKRSRDMEALPTEKRQLSSFRTRMGTILEYALSTQLQLIFDKEYNGQLLLTFAVAHEYPDFYLRDKNLRSRLRIEMKSVDADSDEQAARFDAPTHEINPAADLVILVGWEWKNIAGGLGECPSVFAFLAIPSMEIAKERDQRLIAIGGRIQDGEVYVPSTKEPGKMVPDPGNYGKLWRIILKNRRGTSDLNKQINKFESFMKSVDQHAVERGARKRTRYSSQKPQLPP